jgi:hypothetical protein
MVRRPSPQPSIPNGPWSLWDMLELKAGAFVEAANMLASTVSFISGKSSTTEITSPLFHQDTRLDDADRVYIKVRLGTLSEHVGILGADVTALCMEDALDNTQKDWATWGSAKADLGEIQKTLV